MRRCSPELSSCSAVGARYLLAGRHVEEARTMLRMAVALTAVLAPLQLFIGDQHGLNTLAHQPMKIAAIEAHWDGGEPGNFEIFAWPDESTESNRFLLAPLTLWAVFRWPAVRGQRRQLALGGLLCLAMIPGWILLMNATLLRGHPKVLMSVHFPGVIFGDESPDASARAVSAAGHSTLGSPSRESPAAHPKETSRVPGRVAGPPLAHPSLPPPLPLPRTLVKFADRLVKAITYAYGFLVLLAVGLWPRVFFRRDQQAMLLFGVLLWLAIALRMRVGVDIRYYLPGVIASMGYAGLGLLWIAKWICRLTAGRVDWTGPRRAALCCALVAVVFATGVPRPTPGGAVVHGAACRFGKMGPRPLRPARTAGRLPARNAIGRLLLPGRRRAELLAVLLRGRRPGLYDPGLQARRVDVVERSAATAVGGGVAEAVGLAAGFGPLPRPARSVAAKLFASLRRFARRDRFAGCRGSQGIASRRRAIGQEFPVDRRRKELFYAAARSGKNSR